MSLKTSTVNVRNSIDSYHYQWYEIALVLAQKVGPKESKPRTVGRQTTRENHPYKTVSEYYKRIITIPLIDHLFSSLDERFDIDSVNVYLGLSIVPTKMVSLINNGVDWKAKFKIACEAGALAQDLGSEGAPARTPHIAVFMHTLHTQKSHWLAV